MSGKIKIMELYINNKNLLVDIKKMRDYNSSQAKCLIEKIIGIFKSNNNAYISILINFKPDQVLSS